MLRLIEVKRIRMKKRGEKIDVFYRLVKKRIFFFFFLVCLVVFIKML